MKCSGLTQDQLAQPLPPTDMTLGGMMKHLALVESQCALLRVLSSTNGRKDVAGIWTLAAHATRHLNASTLPRTRPRQCCCGGC